MSIEGHRVRQGPPSGPDRPLDADYPLMMEAYRTLLWAAEPPSLAGTGLREGLAETPQRAASAWKALTSGYQVDPATLFKTFEGDGYDELVLLRGTPFYSLCEHHLLPFHGVAHIGYIANGKIVGLSKLARLLDVFARRLQVQERLTMQVADTIEEHLDPKGTMVVVAAEHLCMAMRGVQKPNTITVTSAVRGAFRDQPESRAEFLALTSITSKGV